MQTTIDLIRHGEPVGGRKYRGQTDDPLSEKGWAQMWAAVGDYAHGSTSSARHSAAVRRLPRRWRKNAASPSAWKRVSRK